MGVSYATNHHCHFLFQEDHLWRKILYCEASSIDNPWMKIAATRNFSNYSKYDWSIIHSCISSQFFSKKKEIKIFLDYMSNVWMTMPHKSKPNYPSLIKQSICLTLELFIIWIRTLEV